MKRAREHAQDLAAFAFNTSAIVAANDPDARSSWLDALVDEFDAQVTQAMADARRAALEEASTIADGCAADAGTLLDKAATECQPDDVRHWGGELDASREIATAIRALLDAAPKPAPLSAEDLAARGFKPHGKPIP